MHRIEPRVVVGRRSPGVSSRHVMRRDKSIALAQLKKLIGELDPPYFLLPMHRIEPRVVVGRRSPGVSSRRVVRHDESLALAELKKLVGELDPPYFYRE